MSREDIYGARLDMLQAALDHINQGFSVFDADLKLVATNRRLFEMLDLPLRLSKRGTHLSQFLRVNAERGEYGDGDIDDLVAKRIERAHRFEPHTFERVRPNGQVILVTGTPIPEGGFVTTYTDVTRERLQQKRLEKTVAERTRALRQSEDWLRLVTDNVPALIAYMGPGPIYRFANRAYAQWFDQTPASIVGLSPADVIGEDLFNEIKPHIERAFQGAAVSYDYERTKADGRVKHMTSTLIPDRTQDGRTLGCFVLSLDVSERKRSQSALAQAQRMEAVGQLSGGLAHDFNNLLTIIIGNTLSLRRQWERLNENEVASMPDLAANLEPILHAARRGEELTQRLLAFAKGGAGEPQAEALEPILENVTRLLSSSLPKCITVSLVIHERGLCVKVDPAELENAIVNLAFNARDAMSEGGELTIELRRFNLAKHYAQTSGLAAGAYAEITVTDTGAGMSAETKRQAFDPFFTTKPFGRGSGLGLSMVYGFTRRAGGAAEIDQTRDHGARIRMFLPAVKGEGGQFVRAPLQSGDLKPELHKGSGEIILVIDDEPDVAAVVRDQLRQLNYSVLISTNAEDALKLAHNVFDIKAVLSDVVMPGQQNGADLAKAIRNARPQLPVILMSGYQNQLASAAEFGQDPQVLRKPFTIETLAATMSEVLNP